LIRSADNQHAPLLIVKHANSAPKEGIMSPHTFNPYYVFTETTDIVLSVITADAIGHVHAGFDIILVDNKYIED